MSEHAIVRKPLLTALIEGQKSVGRVEIKEILFAAQQKTGLHLHPCPVVGYVAEGMVLFQVEGEPEQVLKAGDAFYEPANRRIIHFDAHGEQPMKFIAYYLLGEEDHELITMLE
jgi:quercetin dioxygenase-like cupin family protein